MDDNMVQIPLQGPNAAQASKTLSLVSHGKPNLEYVEGAIFWSNISNDDKNKVHKGPHTQAPKAKQLAKTLSPVTQVETVHAKTTKGQAVDIKRR